MSNIIAMNLRGSEGPSEIYLAGCPIKYSLELSRDLSFLHPRELCYFKSLKYLIRQNTYLTSRYIGKLAVAKYYKENKLSNIELQSGIFGQPIVKYMTTEVIDISLSHNESWACAVAFPATHPLGIDLETMKKDTIVTMQSQCTREEIELVLTQQRDEDVFYTVIWTAKEALSKIIRCGLLIPFSLLEIDVFLDKEDSFIGVRFKNFPQYQAYSLVMGNQVLSIVFPKKTVLEVSSKAIKNLFCCE